jgi:hypothetical protein
MYYKHELVGVVLVNEVIHHVEFLSLNLVSLMGLAR